MSEFQDWLPNVKVLQKVVLQDEQGHYLILTRNANSPASRPSHPDLVGGSMQAEDFADPTFPHQSSLQREITEETGLKALNFRPVHVASGVQTKASGEKVFLIALGYLAQVVGTKPEVILSTEHAKFQWLKPAQALDLDFGADGGFHHAILEKASQLKR